VGCKGGSSDDAAPAAPSGPPPEIRVHPDNGELAFRFFDKTTASFKTVGAVADVPDEVKPAVLVFDASAKAAPPDVLYVADLTKPGPDGAYPYKVVNRYDYDRSATPARSGGSAEPARAAVTLYTTEWCGVCKQAKAWLQSNKIAFVERDLEKDPGAMRALEEDAKRAGTTAQAVAGGVPVIVVGDKILKGFDPNAIQQAL
jgi:glutaredoxin